MADQDTNAVALAYNKQPAFDDFTGTDWSVIEPNDIGTLAATISSVVRDPISLDRQRRKGTIVDLDSAADYPVDLTMSSVLDYADGLMFSQAQGAAVFAPTAVTAGGTGGFTVASGGNLTAGTLVFARGFSNSTNNGMFVVATGSTGTNIRVNGLAAEASPPNNVELEVAGVRGASGDLEINADGNLISTTLDFTTLDIEIGQYINIGGLLTANRFANAANTGTARVRAVAANLITLDNQKPLDENETDFVADTGAGVQVDVLFGRFYRNVSLQDSLFLRQFYTIEIAYDRLANPAGPAYQYSQNNLLNELSLNIPVTDKATYDVAFIGTDTPIPTTTRRTGAATPMRPTRIEAFNTTTDIARLRIADLDDSGLTTDFSDISVAFNNNVGPQKVIGVLGARFINLGNFVADINATAIFTNPDLLTRNRENTTVSMDIGLKNDDGGVIFDFPSMTLGDTTPNFPRDEKVSLSITGNTFASTGLFPYTTSISIFPQLP